MFLQKHFTLCEPVGDAQKDYKSGSTVMVRGFGLSDNSETIIESARTADHIEDLTAIFTEFGDNFWILGRLTEKDKITKQYACYIGRCKVVEEFYLEGTMELELIPQGIFAENISTARQPLTQEREIRAED
jgi:acyl CoA:acetate/3-ketoacid CoA transferase alpha subunit